MIYCNKCGAVLTGGSVFCTACGVPIIGGAPAAAPAAYRRVATHRPWLGVIWILGGLCLLPGGLFLSGMGSGYWNNNFDLRSITGPLPPFVIPLLGAVGLVLVVSSVLALAAGTGFLMYAPWARLLAIVLAIAALINIPFGTIAGVYTLWVLLPAESEAEYRALCERRA